MTECENSFERVRMSEVTCFFFWWGCNIILRIFLRRKKRRNGTSKSTNEIIKKKYASILYYIFCIAPASCTNVVLHIFINLLSPCFLRRQTKSVVDCCTRFACTIGEEAKLRWRNALHHVFASLSSRCERTSERSGHFPCI